MSVQPCLKFEKPTCSLQSEPKRQPLQLSQSTKPAAGPKARKGEATPLPVQHAAAGSSTTLPPESKCAFQYCNTHWFCAVEPALQLQACTPTSSSDLVVQKKKVEQISTWLQADSGPSLLFLSGTA